MNSERPRDAVITVGDRTRRAIEVDGVVVVLLEYVARVNLTLDGADRGSLREYTDDTDTPLGVHQAVWTVQCLAKALDHAHAHARDHYDQDVTPYNVLLFASEDGWAVPKLDDWGLARARNDQSSQSFTPGYAAPEQRQPDQYYRVHPPQNRSLPTRDDPLRTAD